MIRDLQELRKIVGRGLSTFDTEQRTDSWGRSNLCGCPKLEEIIFGSAIRNISIRNSSINRLNIPESNGLLQLEPYGLAYNKELEEVHIPQDMKELPIRLFEGCEKLRIVTGGNGIERIGFGAFGGCVSLQSVPFRIELLNENQFFTYGEWMQYEPEEYRREYGDCANCPKGKWSENNHKWERECDFNLKEYCRDINQCKWEPIKKGVVLKDDYIWCFNDFSYYKKDWHCQYPYARYDHKYVEFTSPSITFTSEGDHVNINHNPQEKIAYELSYPVNRLAETIAFFFEDISYELILDEITRKVDQLDIDAIIDSYETKSSYETFKMNSDTEGEEFSIDRDAKYTDEYLAILLPPIHTYYNDRTACLFHPTDYINPYKKKYDFESYYNTFGKKEVFYSYGPKDVYSLKKEDEKIRKEARRKYNRKDHIDFLVNCRISEITNKKLDIESRLHIKQAENVFLIQSK